MVGTAIKVVAPALNYSKDLGGGDSDVIFQPKGILCHLSLTIFTGFWNVWGRGAATVALRFLSSHSTYTMKNCILPTGLLETDG